MKNNFNHVSFIMDGNNRWSIKNKQSKYDSYKIGAENLFKLTKYIFFKYNIAHVSAFALSTHNLNRSSKLIKPLIKVFEFFANTFNDFDYDFNVRIIGDYEIFDKKLVHKINSINNLDTNPNNTLSIFINYSGKADIENSLKQHLKNNSSYKNFSISHHMKIKNLTDPDILIRTGGFSRLSDYILYNLSFTEIFFMNKLWPDFNKKDLDRQISKYLNVNRKFGH